ncbi:DNA end-binding protein Ku [Desulfonatronum zhilinae]|nr:DNA end-binding protein Ku [Desulfonatronum zhilinae]
MALRSIWKGVIRFGGVSVPVKLFSAVEDRKVHFRLLHASDLTPVEQRMVDPRTGKTIPKEQIRRGLEVETGDIVVISPEELEALVPVPSRDIEITRFIEHGRVNYQWYDRPYFLGPDGKGEQYQALAEVLAKEQRQGIARWTMRKKRYVGSLHEEDGLLKLITLRFADEVIDARAIPRPEGRRFEPLELRMAEQLVNALAGDFEPTEYRDEYRHRVMELVNTKALGNVYRFEKPKQRRSKIASLADTLEQSLNQIRKQHSG